MRVPREHPAPNLHISLPPPSPCQPALQTHNKVKNKIVVVSQDKIRTVDLTFFVTSVVVGWSIQAMTDE